MNKKYTVLLSAVMIGMLAVGVAYAEWTKIITLYGTINTGDFHLTPEVTIPLTFDDGGEQKNIACGSVDAFSESYEYQGWRIYMEKVYPCLTAHFQVALYNDGDIPAGFNGLYFDYLKYGVYPDDLATDPASMGDFTGYTYQMDPYSGIEGDGYKIIVYPDPACTEFQEPKNHIAEVLVILSADDRGGLWPDAPPNSWEQIDPNFRVYADIYVHFNECLPQNTVFKFGLRLEFINWNEVGLV